MGFTESGNLAIEYRWARGNHDIVPDLAIELIHRQVAVIVTSGSESITRAAMAATTTTRSSPWLPAIRSSVA
jgi:putative ABC transport system substrate-binding protein